MDTLHSVPILQAAFSGPMTCLFIIPVAVLFLAFATFQDNNRNTR